MEIYDCTLREGEQADGASFSFEDRIELCKKLDEFGVDFIELGWPLASQEIADSFRTAMKTAKKAKIVAFGSTAISSNPEEDKNLNSILECGAKYACIFGKSSLEHVEKQLKITGAENLKKISKSIEFLKQNNIIVFYDAEHYFDSFKKNKKYAVETALSAAKAGAERIILCDTLGGTLPNESLEIIKETQRILLENGFKIKLGVHFHDDCGLALANALACLDYAEQVQGTINGIGERIGNLNFSEFIPVYVKKMGNNLNMNLRELKQINEEAFRLAGISIPEKRAFVGDSAFAHKAGVHIDAHSKGLSYEHEEPEYFGNKRILLMNSLGGRSSIIHIAENFGHKLDKNNPVAKEKIEELFEELKEYEKKGYKIGSIEAEQFLLIEKYFGNADDFFEIKEWEIKSEFKNGKEKSCFEITCIIDKQLIKEEFCVNGGPVDAAFKTIKKVLCKKYPAVEKISLLDFHVSIARSNKEESSVRTRIDFADGDLFSTVGVDKNILESAIEALEKGFRYYLMKEFKNQES
jgi:2-isopropylmalate synthase